MNDTQIPAQIVMQLTGKTDIPISLLHARTRHLRYLEHGPHIYTSTNREQREDQQIIHSLSLNQEDLDFLYKRAVQGIRLHFCREESGFLNIIAVPIGENGHLDIDIDEDTRMRPIINTLEPCPSLCAPLFSESGLNCWEHEGVYYWMDPNNPQDDKVWFFKGPEGEKIYTDRPASAPSI